MSEAGLE
jgi:hypothetical protein